MSIDKSDVEKLYKAILKLKTLDECKEFFNDLCTENEILQMTQRIISAECLLNGETYEDYISRHGSRHRNRRESLLVSTTRNPWHTLPY